VPYGGSGALGFCVLLFVSRFFFFFFFQIGADVPNVCLAYICPLPAYYAAAMIILYTL